SSSAALMFRYRHLPSSSQSESGICRCLANKVGLGELNMGGGGIGPISLNGIGGSGSSDSIRVNCHTTETEMLRNQIFINVRRGRERQLFDRAAARARSNKVASKPVVARNVIHRRARYVELVQLAGSRVYSLSNKISLLATTLASRVFGLFGFCWSPAFGTGPGTGTAKPLVAVPKLAACGSPPPHGDIAPFTFCSVFSFFGSATEKKVRHRSEPWRDMYGRVRVAD
ncbi:hypothetical protein ALC62_12698, partial [Cyphomyrmex costatus]